MPRETRHEHAKHVPQDRRAGDAIDVVVAVDADPPPILDRREQPFDGLRHPRQQFRLVQRGQGRLHEPLGLAGIFDVPIVQKLSEKRRDAEGSAESIDGGLVMRQKTPHLARGCRGVHARNGGDHMTIILLQNCKRGWHACHPAGL